LWVAGWPMPLRPLHYQLVPGREIFVTERMDGPGSRLANGQMVLKPFLRFLP
ncbi:hypothetical protein EDB81DRAFT_669141, partial [Dactylonectria macrodidyma]